MLKAKDKLGSFRVAELGSLRANARGISGIHLKLGSFRQFCRAEATEGSARGFAGFCWRLQEEPRSKIGFVLAAGSPQSVDARVAKIGFVPRCGIHFGRAIASGLSRIHLKLGSFRRNFTGWRGLRSSRAGRGSVHMPFRPSGEAWSSRPKRLGYT
jgi:hypothetical protein